MILVLANSLERQKYSCHFFFLTKQNNDSQALWHISITLGTVKISSAQCYLGSNMHLKLDRQCDSS